MCRRSGRESGNQVYVGCQYTFQGFVTIRHVQELHDPEGAEAKVGTQDGEETVKERLRPPDLREGDHDDLRDDEQAIDYCERSAGGLIRYGAIAV